eukprot:8200951-Pyramimonas_sp.AAC.1
MASSAPHPKTQLARSGCTCILAEVCHPPAKVRTTIHRHEGETFARKDFRWDHLARRVRGDIAVPYHFCRRLAMV